MHIALLIAAVAAAAACGAALAQGTPPVPVAATVPLDTVSQVLMPILLAIGSAAATVIAAAGVYAASWIKKRLNLSDLEAQQIGLEIDSAHRDALQSAITNAAGIALNRLGNQLAGTTVDVHSEAVASALNSALKSAPDAIAYFGLDKQPQRLAELIVGKIPQIANTATPPAG
jgi:hypothetical protein